MAENNTNDDILSAEDKQEFTRIHTMLENTKIFSELSHNDAPEFNEEQEKKYDKRADKNLNFLSDAWNKLGNSKS